jgi:hypothetical protein
MTQQKACQPVHLGNAPRARSMSLMLFRYVWAGPTTLIGFIFALVTLYKGRLAIVDGVIEAHGAIVRWALTNLTFVRGGVSAITLGHVVLGRDRATLDNTRAHERIHVKQYEQWGPFFIPLYLLASVWAILRGGHAYFDNHFEREAWRLELG